MVKPSEMREQEFRGKVTVQDIAFPAALLHACAGNCRDSGNFTEPPADQNAQNSSNTLITVSLTGIESIFDVSRLTVSTPLKPGSVFTHSH